VVAEGSQMIGILVVSHGRLAAELLLSAEVIAGRLEGFEALCLDWSDDQEHVETKIREAVARVDRGRGVLILTDMFGGTPCNVARSFQEPGKVEILTGVNLPMVLRLACRVEEDKSLSEFARWLQGKAQRSICLATQAADGKRSPDDTAAAGVSLKRP
jgi:PTS system mannose-specific IIA component